MSDRYPTGKRSGARARNYSFAAALVIICVFIAERLEAHLELYHNVEVNLTETRENGTARLYFTIHAPELLFGFENAGSNSFDAEWLRTRTDEEFQTLFARGRTFVKENFLFRIEGEGDLDIETALRFEQADTIRDEKYQSGVPVGCLLASAEIPLSPGIQQLQVKLAEDAGKRLLLVCTRKGAFPETHDLEGGESVSLELPAVVETGPEPRVKAAEKDSSDSNPVEIKPTWSVLVILFSGLCVVLVLSVALIAWRKKQ